LVEERRVTLESWASPINSIENPVELDGIKTTPHIDNWERFAFFFIPLIVVAFRDLVSSAVPSNADFILVSRYIVFFPRGKYFF
jgi:hypothetical protein